MSRLRHLVGLLIVVSVAACAEESSDEARPVVTGPGHLVETRDYITGVAADVYLPDQSGAVPLVVMVPGGAWVAADRAGLGPLAEQLAADGVAVVNGTHRPAVGGVHFPTPVEDVVCEVNFAVARLRAHGLEPRPVIVLGHSSGAHLAALAVLATDRFEGDCNYPPVAADALAGLAGLYDVTEVEAVALPLFGVPESGNPDLWAEGNALTWVGERPSVSVFLAHGEDDDLVPLRFTKAFADALERSGHVVRVEIVRDADHHDIYDPAFIEVRLAAWIETLR